MINNNHNSACNFAENLVSYLYGEIGAAEKARFEAHLPECSSCAEELSSFGVVRSSVIEWRERDFAPLQTPAILLPKAEKTATVETVSTSWLAGLRQLFSLSPAWTGAATAFAALLICAGLFYVAVSSLQNGEKEISEANKNASVKPAVSTPTVEASGTPQFADKDKQNRVEPTKPGVAVNAESANQTTTNRKNTTTVSGRKTDAAKTNDQSKAPKKPAANSPRAPKRSNVQLIADEDEEDETLRLTDLFDEIGGD